MDPANELELRDLRLLEAIAEAGSITGASHRLHLSQSAVSHHLAKLESRLGVPLVERRGRATVPSSKALPLINLSRQFRGQLRAAERELRAATQKPLRLRLSTQCYTAYHWLPGLLRELQSEHSIELDIVLAASRDPKLALESEGIDAAIIWADELGSGFRHHRLFDDRLSVILAPDDPLAFAPRIRPDALAGRQLFVQDIDPSVLQGLGERFFRGIPKRERPRGTRVQLTEVTIELIKAGMGISLLPAWSVLPELERGGVVARRFDCPGAKRTWRLAQVKEHPHSAALQKLARSLKGHLATLARRAGAWEQS